MTIITMTKIYHHHYKNDCQDKDHSHSPKRKDGGAEEDKDEE